MNFKELPQEAKKLINLGVWGLYKSDKDEYFLTTKDTTYQLDLNGNILKTINQGIRALNDYNIVEAIWKV